MRARLSSLMERLRASLFLVPMMGIVAAIAAGLASVALDQRIGDSTADLPFVATSTVESARALLSTIAAATITFAGIAFSVSLLVIQLASSQYSPRVVHTMFRDPFNRRIMALVVGTFTFCLIVLRAVRSPLEDGGDAVIPNLSVAIAFFLGIITILGIVAFIDHSAHAMDVSQILQRVTSETTRHFCDEWRPIDPDSPPPPHGADPDGDRHVVRFDSSGWVQLVDMEALLSCAPERGTLELRTQAGRFATKGGPLCVIDWEPDDPDECDDRIRRAVIVGQTRTMQQDVSYGLRQIVDVALKGLSPGINDPTTARDAIAHAAAALAEAYRHDPPPSRHEGPEGRRLVVVHQHTHDALVRLVFDETRRAAADQPDVCIALLDALATLRAQLLVDGRPELVPALVEQARLVVAGCEAAGPLPTDLDLVRSAYLLTFAAGS